ncbi:MAG: triple tyrosine motif-containing protein [Bacteroidota bacterium]
MAQGYYATKYDIKDGLLDDRCAGLYQDKKGFLWIANGHGVSRFDGKHFKNYSLPNYDFIGIYLGSHSFVERDSAMFFNTFGGLGKVKNNKIELCKIDSFATSYVNTNNGKIDYWNFGCFDKHGRTTYPDYIFDGKKSWKIPFREDLKKWSKNYVFDNLGNLWYTPFNDEKSKYDKEFYNFETNKKYKIDIDVECQFFDIEVINNNLFYALVLKLNKLYVLKVDNSKTEWISVEIGLEDTYNFQLNIIRKQALLTIGDNLLKIDLETGAILNKVEYKSCQVLPEHLKISSTQFLIKDKVLDFESFTVSPLCYNLSIKECETHVSFYLKDNENNIWLSTANGLYKCSPSKLSIKDAVEQFEDEKREIHFSENTVYKYEDNNTTLSLLKSSSVINSYQLTKPIKRFNHDHKKEGHHHYIEGEFRRNKKTIFFENRVNRTWRYGQLEELYLFEKDVLVRKLSYAQLNRDGKFIHKTIATPKYYATILKDDEYDDDIKFIKNSKLSVLYFDANNHNSEIIYKKDIVDGTYLNCQDNSLYFIANDSLSLLQYDLEKNELITQKVNLKKFKVLWFPENETDDVLLICKDFVYQKKGNKITSYKQNKVDDNIEKSKVWTSKAIKYNSKYYQCNGTFGALELEFKKDSCIFKRLDRNNLLKANSLFSVYFSKDYRFFISHNNASGYLQIVDFKNLTSEQLTDKIIEPTPNFFNLLNGNIVFNSAYGVAELNPYLDVSNKVAPKIYLESVYLSTNEFGILNEPLDEKTINYFKTYIDAHSEFKFNFVGICLRDGNKVRYKYKLEGYDADWVDGQDATFAKYKNVPAGKYTFLVKACNNDGVWSTEPASFSFTIPAPFYQTWWFISLCVLVGIGLIYLLIKSREKQLRKKNQALEQVVQQRTHEIEQQKEIVEEKNKEITDSINYAKRIQHALLASKKLLDENLNSQPFDQNSYFIYFQPKDVVSGDFYWASKLKNENFALVTADSTGHGVPGAFMSLLNISCLNEAINERGFIDSKDILNHTRKRVIASLAEDGSAEGGKDGMDCSILVFDKEKKNLMYTAANNPVWIIRKCHSDQSEESKNGDASFVSMTNQLIELLPDKMPVGKHDRDYLSFTSTTIPLQKGDIIYTLTDGFPDQFGGPKAKKFKYKPLQQLLLSICDEEMEVQQQKLKHALENWKGILEQVDDILIIGIKI